MKNTQRKTIKTKNFGQVFTPAEIVFRMLDLCNYNNYTILNKKIIEPSFGATRSCVGLNLLNASIKSFLL